MAKVTETVGEWIVMAVCNHPALVVLGLGGLLAVFLLANAVRLFLCGRYGTVAVDRPPVVNGWLAVLAPFALDFRAIVSFAFARFGWQVNPNPPPTMRTTQ
jgi:hypothetical protein